MLWVWLRHFIRLVGKLFFPPPNPEIFRKINPNEVCPVCGATNGFIRFRMIGADKSGIGGVPMVVHTCKICECSCGEPPISAPKYPIFL